MFAPFARISLFLVSVCGWAILFYGGWIAFRGTFFYAFDPVLMGTGGGLALGGLFVIALTIGAWAQISTARDTAAMRALMERQRPEASSKPPAPKAPSTKASPRAEPTLGRQRH